MKTGDVSSVIEWVLAGVNIERRQPNIVYIFVYSTNMSVNQVKSQIIEASAGKKVDTVDSPNSWYI